MSRFRDRAPLDTYAETDQKRTDRRSWLRRGGTLAAGAAAAAVVNHAPNAGAAAGDPVTIGSSGNSGPTTTWGSTTGTTLKLNCSASNPTLMVTNLSNSKDAPAITASGPNGAAAISATTTNCLGATIDARAYSSGNAISAFNTGGNDTVVLVRHTDGGIGVDVRADGGGRGLRVVAGTSTKAGGIGIEVSHVNATATNPAVRATATRGIGVDGRSTSATAVSGTSSSGVGVGGSSQSSRGGQFYGGAAAIQLLPSFATTHPTTGQTGDLFVDGQARLWYCRGGTNWKRLDA